MYKKGIKNMSNARFLWLQAWHYNKKFLVDTVLYTISKTIDPFIAIVYPKIIIDSIQEGKSASTILLFCIAMGVSFLLTKNGLSYAQKDIELQGEFLMMKLRLLCNRINMSVALDDLENPAYLDRKIHSMKIIWNSSDFIAYHLSFADIFVGITQTVLLLIFTLNINWILGIGVLMIYIINTFLHRIANKKNYSIDESLAPTQRKINYFNSIFSDFSYGTVIRVNSLADWLIDKAKKIRNENSKQEGRKDKNLLPVNIISSALDCIQEMGVYIYLIISVIVHKMTIGNFTMGLLAIRQFSVSLEQITNAYTTMGIIGFYMTDFRLFLSDYNVADSELEQTLNSDNIEIEFKNVWFKYPRTDEYILKGVNISIHKGEKLSIVGENGAGKSTLVKLLLRLYTPSEGTILLNGVDIQEIDYSRYQKLIATVFQDYRVYSFSVAENIMFDVLGSEDENIKRDRLKSAIERSGLSQKVGELKNNFDTILGKQFVEDGVELSGGEAQKLAVARALYKDSPILILDEPTANLSPIAEHMMYSKLADISKDRTAFFISHRLASSKFCTRVIVLDNGIIAEDGSHENLLKQKGKYAELYRLQAQYYQ
ncbi:MAG: ABC transporter ATP-binding protein/permease [Clostridium sp.]|jgi:ABC-type multidrug transport system fused ATPase/permease subunit|nr:ABC transporter ATP-binding protein/permease [Clostridium sp.]